MSAWDIYQEQSEVRGSTKRGSALRRTTMRLSNRVPDSLSYQEVEMMGANDGYVYGLIDPETGIYTASALVGQDRNVAIINSDNLNEKYIFSLPGEDIEHGSLVHWMDNYWLVTERDANTTVYTRAKMIQCNHLLRWVTSEDKICEQWCIIEDGTKLECSCTIVWRMGNCA